MSLNLDIVIDSADDCFYTVRIVARNFPEAIVRELADWDLSMELGVDMESLQSDEWDVSEPEELDGTWFVEYSREV